MTDMKKTKRERVIYLTLLVVIIFFNISLLAKGIMREKKYLKEKENLIAKNQNNNELFLRDLNLLSQTIFINREKINISNEEPEAQICLIYAYAGDECGKCLFEDILLLKEKIEEYTVKNVIVLPAMEDNRNVNISLKANLRGIHYKRIDREDIGFPVRLDGSSARFFAVLMPSGKIMLPFFPDAEFPERTRTYLDFVFSKYFDACENSGNY